MDFGNKRFCLLYLPSLYPFQSSYPFISQILLAQLWLAVFPFRNGLQSSIFYTIFQEMTSYLLQARQSNTSEEQDYYFLRPMFQKLPPNQIISQKYAPDIIPQVKLMYPISPYSSNKDQRRNNIQYLPPRVRNSEMEIYAEMFNIFDYLGKHYAERVNQIVYFKFNNAKYNLMVDQRFTTRLISAFYVPFQQIYSQHQTYFTKNMGLAFPETCNNCLLPSAKYNKGCSFDPIFCSTYESGNLFAAVRKNPFEYDLILQNDTNSCETINWFNFSVQFSQQGYYSFKIVNLTQDMTKIYERGMKIAYTYLNPIVNRQPKKNGQGWGLCGENIRFSKSGIQRQNKKGEYYYQLYFQFKCKNKHDIVMFALDVPYNSLDAEAFFNKILFKKIKSMLKIEKNQYGKTISGTPLVSYQISRKKLRGESIQMAPILTETLLGKDKRKSINLSPINKSLNNLTEPHNKSIIIMGRSKGSDINGSFIIQGMIDYLLDNIEFQSMKRVFDFYFIPLVNVDAVKYGNSECNLTGSKLQKNWEEPNKYYQAEIYSLKEYLQEINKESPIALIVDLATEQQDIYSSVIGVKNDNEDVEDCRIFPFVLSRRNRLFSFQKSTFFQKNENSSMCCVLSELFTKSLIYQFNVSHFQYGKKEENAPSQPSDGQLKQSTTDSYRLFGKDLLSNYLEHVKLYDKNLLLKDKWIKQIDEIQGKLTKKTYHYEQEPRVEDRFPSSFYEIKNLREIVSCNKIKVSGAVTSNKQLNPPKTFDRISRSLKRQKQFKSSLPHSINDFMSKRNQTEEYLKSKIQLNTDAKKLQPEDCTLEKPISLFRIGQKKTSILLNCPSNTLNFQVQGQNKQARGRKQKSTAEKELLKKELSTKMLKKVKIQDTIRGWKTKQRVSDMKFGEFMVNS